MALPAKTIHHQQERWLFVLSRWWYRIITVLVLFGLLLAGWGLFWPLLQRESIGDSLSYRENTQRVAELQQQKAEVERLLAAIQAISNEDRALLQAILPSAQEVPTLLAQIESIARQSGLVLTSFTVAETKIPHSRERGGVAVASSPLAVQKLTLNLTFRAGEYAQFKQLVEALERNIRLVDITSMTFSPDAKGYTINAVTYYVGSSSPAL